MALKYTSFAETSIFDSQTLPRTWVLIPFWLDFDMKVVVIFFLTNGNHNKCCLQLFLQHGHLNYLAQSRPSSLHQLTNEFEFCFRQQVLRLHHPSPPPARMRARLGQHSYVALRDILEKFHQYSNQQKNQIFYFLASFFKTIVISKNCTFSRPGPLGTWSEKNGIMWGKFLKGGRGLTQTHSIFFSYKMAKKR